MRLTMGSQFLSSNWDEVEPPVLPSSKINGLHCWHSKGWLIGLVAVVISLTSKVVHNLKNLFL
ncbi:hypothetical protein Syun_019572 [Stephania yunnanensis]|uniref:Uncharacterized protein n=1 Tax=Stephania yunnanensis TaxID=152371 RepID=A0AAP0IV36_9MAGN